MSDENTPLLTQVIYISFETEAFSKEMLRELLEKARKNNTPKGISGMLVYDDGFFLQVIEGKEEAINALYEKIERDKRHSGMRLLLRKQIPEKEFEDWSMGFIDTSIHADQLEGFVPFKEFKNVITDESVAKRQIKKFQKGAWRHKVDT